MSLLKRSKAFPVRMVVDVSRRCNLSCWYCHSTSGRGYRGPELAQTDIDRIFQAAEESQVFDVTLTGGEPTLWYALPEAMELSGRLRYPALQLITNATLLDDKRLHILSKGNIQRICVSLDGSRNIHEKNRGKGSFDRTMAGIESLRQVVDNVSVISVLDASSYDGWMQLTWRLIDMGVVQHHLAPVCFAGGATVSYNGLSSAQFLWVRKTVNQMKKDLPAGFTLRFNDALVSGLQEETVSLQTFTEVVKGFQVVVRPNGDVNAAIRAWGRSWLDNEKLGNIREQSLRQILNDYAQQREDWLSRAFSGGEEVRRKFHLDLSDEDVATDLNDVKRVASGDSAESLGGMHLNRDEVIEEILLQAKSSHVVARLSHGLASHPNRFRIRTETDFGMVFDRLTFEVTLLANGQMQQLRGMQ